MDLDVQEVSHQVLGHTIKTVVSFPEVYTEMTPNVGLIHSHHVPITPPLQNTQIAQQKNIVLHHAKNHVHLIPQLITNLTKYTDLATIPSQELQTSKKKS